MKNYRLLLIAALALLLSEVLPMQAVDAAELSPVTLITVEKKDDVVRTVSDTGDVGYGRSLEAALENMQAASAKTLFFGTVQSMVFADNALSCAADAAMLRNLRPATRVYSAQTLPEAKNAADFLRLHAADETLGRLRANLLRGEPMQFAKLICRDGRMILAE